jgi:hypothetical protein
MFKLQLCLKIQKLNYFFINKMRQYFNFIDMTKDEIYHELQYANKFYDLETIPDTLLNDIDIAMEMIKSDGRNIRYASYRLKNDKQLVMEAVKSNHDAFEYATLLQNDTEFIKDLLKIDAYVFYYASEKIKKNKALNLLAIENGYPIQLTYFQDDKEIATCAIKYQKNTHILRHLSERLRHDRDILILGYKYDNDPKFTIICFGTFIYAISKNISFRFIN